MSYDRFGRPQPDDASGGPSPEPQQPAGTPDAEPAAVEPAEHASGEYVTPDVSDDPIADVAGGADVAGDDGDAGVAPASAGDDESRPGAGGDVSLFNPYAPPHEEVPASLELSYTTADLGLSASAYERTFPYERRGRRAANQRARRVGREIIETLILAALIFLAVRAVVQNFRVEGASMDPSLDNGQYLLVNKAIYFRLNMDKVHDILPFVPGDGTGERHLFRAPRRGDVIVFRFHLDDNRDFIKRVIGVPGDTVEVRDGTVIINGTPIEEDYILARPDYTYGPSVVPEGHYFVLGDNRRNSYDSHAWGGQCNADEDCEFVPEENIIGQAWVGYWPWKDLGLINNKDINP